MYLGATCLHVAVAAGQEEAVRILIARGMFVGQVYEKNFFFFF
jgi:hypothetical protein